MKFNKFKTVFSLITVTLIFAALFMSCERKKAVAASYENQGCVYNFYDDGSFDFYSYDENLILAEGTYSGTIADSTVLLLNIKSLNNTAVNLSNVEFKITDKAYTDGEEVFRLAE